jgi:hypothetical protein
LRDGRAAELEVVVEDFAGGDATGVCRQYERADSAPVAYLWDRSLCQD